MQPAPRLLGGFYQTEGACSYVHERDPHHFEKPFAVVG
jgi:hypothetical protein